MPKQDGKKKPPKGIIMNGVLDPKPPDEASDVTSVAYRVGTWESFTASLNPTFLPCKMQESISMRTRDTTDTSLDAGHRGHIENDSCLFLPPG